MPRDLVALVAFIDSRISSPHDFDGNCCARYVLGAVEAQFGEAPPVAVAWSTARGAKRAIAKLGGFEATVDRLFRRIDPAQAVFGDIAGVACPVLGFHVMLVEGQTLVAPGERGNTRLARARMLSAWSAEPLQ